MKWYLVVAKEETGTPLGITIPALSGLGASASHRKKKKKRRKREKRKGEG